MSNMVEYRARLDQIDHKLLETLAERIDINKKVRRYKAEHQLPVVDPTRESQLLQSRKQIGEQLGIAPHLTEELFKYILKHVTHPEFEAERSFDMTHLQREIESINHEIRDLLSKRGELVNEYNETSGGQPLNEDNFRALLRDLFPNAQAPKAEEKQPLLVSRKHKPADTVVRIGDTEIGNGNPLIIAGPCSVEDAAQMEAIGAHLRREDIRILRGGAYKPRTSPYDFQGLGLEGLKLLSETAKRHGMHCVSEIVKPEDIEMACDYVDIIQIGARNMQNFELLKAAGEVRKPILLKRGLSATIEEFLHAAEYIAARGNDQILLCERGIRTYEKATRNTLDISAVPLLKQESHLPVIVDVSHSTGRKDIMVPIAKAALAAGADALIIETHNNPPAALSDAKQQLDLQEFSRIMTGLRDSRFLQVPAHV